MSQGLARVVGLWGAVGMGLGSILGTGVFVSLAIGAGIGGASVVLATALAAFVATCNGLSSAQLAAAHPISGGTYEYGYRFLNPTIGFSAGVMFLVAKSASAATAALGSVGGVLLLAGIDVDPNVRTGLAVAVVLGMTALVASGVRRSNTFNLAIVGLTIGTLATFVGTGLATVEGPIDLSGWGTFEPMSLLATTALMFVAYTGYGRIATLGEEVQEPAVTIPRAIIATLIVSMVLYVSVAATAVLVVGADAFAEAATTAAPLQVVARAISAPVATIVAVGAVTAMLGVLLNLVLGLSRVAFAMARRRDLPESFAAVSSAQSPVRAVWLVGLVIAGLVLLGDVRSTWTFSAFTVLIYYSITNLAALALPPEHRRFPRLVSVLGLVSCAGLAVFVPLEMALAGATVLFVGLVARSVLGGGSAT
ncbi:MAG: APC family permease [Myxococcota bacterium]